MALTRSIIANTLSSEIGLSRKSSAEVISVLLNAIVKSLKAGEDVRIRNFGRFKVITNSRRRKQNFQSEGLLSQPSQKVVRFKCSKILKVCIQGAAGACEDLSGYSAIIEHLQKNIEISDRLQKALHDHCRWVESEGRKGKRANLARFDLKGADLFGCNLRSANLSKGRLPNADLSDCDLENANLENADLRGASLAWTNLRNANLRGACLRDADLRWADLKWADLSEADLSRANLSGADLSDATLTGAKLRGARVKNTTLGKKNPFSPAGLKLRLRKKLKF